MRRTHAQAIVADRILAFGGAVPARSQQHPKQNKCSIQRLPNELTNAMQATFAKARMVQETISCARNLFTPDAVGLQSTCAKTVEQT